MSTTLVARGSDADSRSTENSTVDALPAAEQSGLWHRVRSAMRRLGSLVRRAFLRHPILATTALCLSLTVPFYGSRGLFETSEGRYAECARQMLKTGSFWTPVLNGHPHLTKPPLTYWAIAAGLKTIGISTWGARAYLLAAHCLVVLFAMLLAGELYGRRSAIMTAIVLSGAPYMLAGAQVVTTDLLVTAWIAMAMWAFWRGLRSGRNRYVVLMWLAMGLGMLTKGPVGLLPFFGGLLPVYLLTRCARADADGGRSLCARACGRLGQCLNHFRPGLLDAYAKLHPPSLFHPLGLLLFVVLGFGWFATDHLGDRSSEGGLFFAAYWLAHEVFGRIFLGEFHRNPQFTYALAVYVPILCFGLGPWFLWALTEPRSVWQRMAAASQGTQWAADPRTLYLALSLIGPGVIYFTAKSKLPLYVLPLAVPLGILWGRYMADCLRRRRISWTVLAVLIVVAVPSTATIRWGLSVLPARRNMKTLAAALQDFRAHDPFGAVLCVGRSFNGLQFELQRELPVASWEEIIADAPHIAHRPEDVWLLLPRDFTEQLTEAAAESLTIVPLTDHWRAVAWPLEADEIVYWPSDAPAPDGFSLRQRAGHGPNSVRRCHIRTTRQPHPRHIDGRQPAPATGPSACGHFQCSPRGAFSCPCSSSSSAAAASRTRPSCSAVNSLNSGMIGPVSAMPASDTARCSTRTGEIAFRRSSNARNVARIRSASATSPSRSARSIRIDRRGATHTQPEVNPTSPKRVMCATAGCSPIPLTTISAGTCCNSSARYGSSCGSSRTTAYLIAATQPSATNRRTSATSRYS
ncbi:MAG: glycosyltransferase family 39 protein [Planctomycetota bacterium]|nr:MAG: glycosyltransferase family 39 protein [Planctomycetota bacterium]